MKTFIMLTKYNTRQRREEGNPLLVVKYLVYYPFIIVSNLFMGIRI